MTESPKSRLFFVISGEHDELPAAEIRSILLAESIPFEIICATSKLMIIDAPSRALDVVGRRSLMLESCGSVILETIPAKEEIFRRLRDSKLFDMLEPGGSFAVRSLRVPGSDKTLRRESLERELGSVVLERAKGAIVSLRNPDKTFLAILSPNRFTFGVIGARRRRGEVSARRPRRRPFFHPSTMQPKLARCMVNLARIRPGELLLDPFCGAGGHLIEGGLIGCGIVGVDINEKMIRGTSKNLRAFGVDAEALLLADATHLPISKVDSIVTDPPYGRASSTGGLSARELLNAFFEEATSILAPGHFACLATPSPLEESSMSQFHGFEIVENYQVYVHRSLTRQISVLRKSD